MAIPRATLVELLHHEPFRPFLIHADNGNLYPVTGKKHVILMQSELFYAFPNLDRWTIIHLSHIASVNVEQAA